MIYSSSVYQPCQLEDYDEGKCQVMAVGRLDTINDLTLMSKFCERGLVYTDSLVLENVSKSGSVLLV